MPLRRTINFQAALRDMRRERIVQPVTFVTASGAFDRAAIMKAAVRFARSLGATGLTWARKMALALRSVWQKAHAERAAFALPLAA